MAKRRNCQLEKVWLAAWLTSQWGKGVTLPGVIEI
jgi:hypothetical protein